MEGQGKRESKVCFDSWTCFTQEWKQRLLLFGSYAFPYSMLEFFSCLIRGKEPGRRVRDESFDGVEGSGVGGSNLGPAVAQQGCLY